MTEKEKLILSLLAEKPKPKNHWLSRDGMPTIIRNNNCPVDFKRTEMDEWLFRARAAA